MPAHRPDVPASCCCASPQDTEISPSDLVFRVGWTLSGSPGIFASSSDDSVLHEGEIHGSAREPTGIQRLAWLTLCVSRTHLLTVHFLWSSAVFRLGCTRFGSPGIFASVHRVTVCVTRGEGCAVRQDFPANSCSRSLFEAWTQLGRRWVGGRRGQWLEKGPR